MAKEANPGQWWVLKEVGRHCPQRDDPLRKRQVIRDQQGHFCTRNLERMALQEEVSGTIGIKQRHKEPRHEGAMMSEKQGKY
jgi:hypothetical protein